MKGNILNKWLTDGKCKNEEYENVTEPELEEEFWTIQQST